MKPGEWGERKPSGAAIEGERQGDARKFGQAEPEPRGGVAVWATPGRAGFWLGRPR